MPAYYTFYHRCAADLFTVYFACSCPFGTWADNRNRGEGRTLKAVAYGRAGVAVRLKKGIFFISTDHATLPAHALLHPLLLPPDELIAAKACALHAPTPAALPAALHARTAHAVHSPPHRLHLPLAAAISRVYATAPAATLHTGMVSAFPATGQRSLPSRLIFCLSAASSPVALYLMLQGRDDNGDNGQAFIFGWWRGGNALDMGSPRAPHCERKTSVAYVSL